MSAHAQLLAIVEVPRDGRVRCEAPGCNHPVFRRIHVVRENETIHVYGSECFKKLFESSPLASVSPQYTDTDGRHLTAEERQLLIENTEQLIKQFESEFQAELASKPAVAVAPQLPASSPQPTNTKQDAVAKAKEIVRAKFGVNPDLPGWRGLVLAEARRLLKKN